jgi:hypothetical protein
MRVSPANNQPPAPIRSGRRRAVAVTLCGVVVAALLLVVVLNIEPPQPAAQPSPPIPEAAELIAPGDLRQDELTGSGFDIRRSTDVTLPEGAGIEVQEGNRVAQRYRFTHSEPRPGGWIELQQPEVELYLSDDRLLLLTGNSALVKAPQQSLVSGTLTGDVAIRMFELEPGHEIDLRTDLPALIVRTNEAQFDNFLGEVRCDGDVDIQSSDLHLPGKGLRLRINDQLRRPEWLRIEEVDYILLSRLPDESAAADAQTTRVGESSPKPPSDRPAARGKGRQRDAAATRPARRERQGRRPAATDADPFYRLTLHDNVTITQGDTDAGWTATGDELRLVFSLKGGTLRDAVSQRWNDPSSRVAEISRLASSNFAALLPMLAIAATQPTALDDLYQSTPDEIRITCAGGLTMAPLEDDEPHPASVDDSELELIGTPVHLVSRADATEVFCASLQYENPRRMLRLAGSAERPLLMNSPELRAGGDVFWLDQLVNVGGFDKGGWLEFVQIPDAAQDGTPPGAESAPAQIRVTWSDSVRLEFDRAPGQRRTTHREGRGLADAGGALRSAVFNGDVHAAANEGDLTADVLALDLIQAPDGRTIPTQLTATGHVVAADREQTMWADQVVASFREHSAGENRPDDTSADGRMRDVEVETMLATGDVQVRLPDGSRAFADVLDANAITGVLVLESPDLAIASQTMIIDQGTRLELYRDSKTGRWPGAGRARVFRDAIIAESDDRIARPVIDDTVNPTQTLATWTDEMVFDSAINDGAGAITLRGHVTGESTPSALDRSTMTSGSLTLEFAHTPDDAEVMSEPSAGTDVLSRGKRQLMRLIARDNARLESKSWSQAEHSDEPRIFYLTGDEIEYNNLTLEASVPGEGRLVVHDVRPTAPSAAAEPDQAPSTVAPFAAKGSSLFHWMNGLEMTRADDHENLYTIIMSGGVDAIHRDLKNDETVFRGDALHISALRTNADRPADASVDLGGSMELKRLRGLGSIYVRTPQRDVTCDEFDYNLITRVSKLAAAPGTNVMVITRGSPHPMRAEEMLWNMDADTISITRGAGTAPR